MLAVIGTFFVIVSWLNGHMHYKNHPSDQEAESKILIQRMDEIERKIDLLLQDRQPKM